MKWAFRNKTAKKKKGRKWRFSSCWFSLICSLPYIFLSFIRTIFSSSMLCENTRKSLNQQIWVLVHFKILIFSDFSNMWVGLEKES